MPIFRKIKRTGMIREQPPGEIFNLEVVALENKKSVDFAGILHNHFIDKTLGMSLEKTPATSISLLYAPIAQDMQAVDEIIRKSLHSDIVLIRQVAEYIIHSGGKRLRPALLLMCARAAGYEGTAHHQLAAVIEFIHTATLLHDDVVDESALRRGQSTANALFGNAASVLVGDFLYSRAFQMMVNVGSVDAMRILADATNIISEGEVLQLLNVGNTDATEEDYLRVIRYKTAKLFEAAAELGALLGGKNKDEQASFACYGMHLGTAFQLIDDVLDYASDEAKTGKHVGDDLAEGKPTLPLIHVIKHGTPAQSALVKEAIEQGGRTAFAAVLEAIHATNALTATRQYAMTEAALAKAALAHIAPSQFAQALLELPQFAVSRDH